MTLRDRLAIKDSRLTSSNRLLPYAAFEIYFTKLLLATGSSVCSSGKLISLAI